MTKLHYLKARNLNGFAFLLLPDAIRAALAALPYEMVQLRQPRFTHLINWGPRRSPPGGRFAADAIYRAHPDAPRPPIPEECLKRSYE